MLRGLVGAAALVALADAAWFAVFVLYLELRLDAGAVGFGLFLATGAVGGLAGPLLADRLIGRRGHRAVRLGSIAVTAVTPALLLAAPTTWAAVVVVVASWQGLQAPFALSAGLGVAALVLWWRAARHGPDPLTA